MALSQKNNSENYNTRFFKIKRDQREEIKEKRSKRRDQEKRSKKRDQEKRSKKRDQEKRSKKRDQREKNGEKLKIG